MHEYMDLGVKIRSPVPLTKIARESLVQLHFRPGHRASWGALCIVPTRYGWRSRKEQARIQRGVSRTFGTILEIGGQRYTVTPIEQPAGVKLTPHEEAKSWPKQHRRQ